MKVISREHHIHVDNDVVECNFVSPPSPPKAKKVETDPWEMVVDDTLKSRCRRMYGWSEAFTDRVCKGYRQFLELKIVLKDWNADKFEPPLFIKQMWNAHILDTRKYIADCMVHFEGQVIHHNADGETDPSSLARRLETTKVALQARFDDIDSSVWVFELPIPSTSNAADPAAPVTHSSGSGVPSDASSTPSPSAASTSSGDTVGSTLVQVTDAEGETTRFRMRLDQPLGILFGRYAERLGLDKGMVRFVLGDKTLSGNDTPQGLNLGEGHNIQVVLGTSG